MYETTELRIMATLKKFLCFRYDITDQIEWLKFNRINELCTKSYHFCNGQRQKSLLALSW